MLRLLHYLRLRLTVGLIRLLMRLRRGPPKAHPARARTLAIPSRDPNRTIAAHLYLPPTAPSAGPLPTLVNFHGSGFVLPMHGSDAPFCARAAQHAGHAVIDVRYRLAPEHPFPAALHDALDAVAYARARPAEYDAARLSVAGFSAGANLALVCAGVACEARTFRSVLAFYPPCDLSVEPGEKRAPDAVVGKEKGIPAGLARVFDACYMPEGVDRADARVSPRFAEMGRWPEEVVVLTGAGDTLALEAEALAGRIEGEAEGVRVTRRRFEGVGHAWDKGAKEGSAEERATEESYGMVLEVLKRVVA